MEPQPVRAASLSGTLAERRRVASGSGLEDLLPDGLPASATCELAGEGATSLALGLAAALCYTEGFVAAIGLPDLGLEAAAEIGLPIDRLVLCPAPGRAWPDAAALALEGCGLVLLAPSTACTETTARRLGARVRDRRALLLLVHGRAAPPWSWPGVADVVFEVGDTCWHGLFDGPGRLEEREVTVTVSGRRARPRSARLALPGASGRAGSIGPIRARLPDRRPGAVIRSR